MSFLGEHMFTFGWITQLHGGYWRGKDALILSCRQPHVDNELIVSWLVERNAKLPLSLLFFLLTVLMHCRRQPKNNSMRLTDNCRYIYTDMLILACCLIIQLELMQYAHKQHFFIRDEQVLKNQRCFFLMIDRNIWSHVNNLASRTDFFSKLFLCELT